MSKNTICKNTLGLGLVGAVVQYYEQTEKSLKPEVGADRVGRKLWFSPWEIRLGFGNATPSEYPLAVSRGKMANGIREWSGDDCIDFVKKTGDSSSGQLSESDIADVVRAFRKHHITGSTFSHLKDSEWEELIPAIGARACIREAVQNVINQEYAVAMELFLRTGRPTKKPDRHPKKSKKTVSVVTVEPASTQLTGDEPVVQDSKRRRMRQSYIIVPN